MWLGTRAVQAARLGEWVLLDELNLAPSDTLQRLSGLLDAATMGDGGLCLTERGDVETLAIHVRVTSPWAAVDATRNHGRLPRHEHMRVWSFSVHLCVHRAGYWLTWPPVGLHIGLRLYCAVPVVPLEAHAAFTLNVHAECSP